MYDGHETSQSGNVGDGRRDYAMMMRLIIIYIQTENEWI